MQAKIIKTKLKILKSQIEDCRLFYAELKSIQKISASPNAYIELLGNIEELANKYKEDIRSVLNGKEI